jgi:hypothetical protein
MTTPPVVHHLYRQSIAPELVESTLANVASYYDVSVAEMQQHDIVVDPTRMMARAVAVLALRELGAPFTQIATAMDRSVHGLQNLYNRSAHPGVLLDTMHALLGTQHGVMLGHPVPELPRSKPVSIERQIEPALRGLTGSELYWIVAYVNVVVGARSWHMCGSILHGGQWLAAHPVVLDRVLDCLHDPTDRTRLHVAARRVG